MNSIISLSACKQWPLPLPLVNFQRGVSRKPFLISPNKDKVVVILGATGCGKSRLAIDLATHYGGEVVNSDKMQVYKGLDILTNKVPKEELRVVPHHLLSFVDPNSDYNANDFCAHASIAIDSIVKRDRLPIIAGGSNSYIEALLEYDTAFRLRYQCCFLWVDVSLNVLHSYVRNRVDHMVESGLVDEVRGIFDPKADNGKGIRRSIGFSELDKYFNMEDMADEGTKKRLFEEAIARIKVNSCWLTLRQLKKIYRFYTTWQTNVHILDATQAREKTGEEGDEAWEKLVLGPSIKIVDEFLRDKRYFNTHQQSGCDHANGCTCVKIISQNFY